MSANMAVFAYLIASVCFIMALRGLSSPESARQGNVFGVVGMVLAVATTLANPEVVNYGTIIVGMLIGGAIGTVVALKIQMTALPQLVAAFHSLVGLAAVLVAARLIPVLPSVFLGYVVAGPAAPTTPALTSVRGGWACYRLLAVKGMVRHHRNGELNQPLHGAKLIAFGLIAERDRCARSASPSGPADPVYVNFGLNRHVVIEDMTNVINVEAT